MRRLKQLEEETGAEVLFSHDPESFREVPHRRQRLYLKEAAMRYPTETPPAFTLTAGPVDAYPEVLRAMGTTVLYDFDPAFQARYEEIAQMAQRAMGTPEPPVILQGEPVLGLEAAAASLIARDDVVLNLARGSTARGSATGRPATPPGSRRSRSPMTTASIPRRCAGSCPSIRASLSSACASTTRRRAP